MLTGDSFNVLSGYKTYIAAAAAFAGAVVKVIAVLSDLADGQTDEAWVDAQTAYAAIVGALALVGVRHAIQTTRSSAA